MLNWLSGQIRRGKRGKNTRFLGRYWCLAYYWSGPDSACADAGVADKGRVSHVYLIRDEVVLDDDGPMMGRMNQLRVPRPDLHGSTAELL